MPHIIMINNGIKCTICGEEYHFTLPCSIKEFVNQGDHFATLHESCHKPPNATPITATNEFKGFM